jgi:hypothetical protein
MRWIPNSFTLAALVIGCGPAIPASGPARHLTAAPSDADRISQIAQATLEADTRPEPADTRFTHEAEVVADGRRRSAAPRFAGIEPGGQVVVGSTRVDILGNFAWALVEYRWLAPAQDLIREGWATLVFVRAPAGQGWLISHAHSSLAR